MPARRDAAAALRASRRVLVIRPRFLGDLVLVTPLLRALREAAPEARLALLAEQRYASLFAGDALVDEVIATGPRAAAIPGAFRLAGLAGALRARRFDAVFDLFANPRTAFLTLASGAALRVGTAGRGRHRAYTHHPRIAPGPVPAVRWHLAHLDTVAPPGSVVRDETPRIDVTPAERAEAEALLARLGVPAGRPVVGLHPGASWPGKRWTVAGFRQLAAHFTTRRGAEVVVTHGPGEEPRAREVAVAGGEHAHLVPPLDWRPLAALLSRLELYIANDCGPMHLAAATGTATVGIFGPSDPAVWFPYPRDAGHRVADAALPCRPCPGSVCGARECMAVLDPARVIAVAEDAWQSVRAGFEPARGDRPR